MGRPKLPKGEARSILIVTRVSPDENKTILAAVKASNEEKTAWIRNTLLSAATEGKSLP